MIHAYLGDSMYYDVQDYMRKWFGYNKEKNTINLDKFNKNFDKLNLDLRKKSEDLNIQTSRFVELLYGILMILQDFKSDIENDSNLKKFVVKTISYLKENYVFVKSEDDDDDYDTASVYNHELQYALDNYPNYPLDNNYCSVEDIEKYFGTKLNQSKCKRYYIGTIDAKFGIHFPEIYQRSNDVNNRTYTIIKLISI